MSTTNLYIRPELRDKKNEVPIYLVYQNRGKKFKLYTGFKTQEEHWDAKLQKLSDKAENALVINENIQNMRKQLIEFVKTQASIDSALDLKNAFTKQYEKRIDKNFFTVYQQYLTQVISTKKSTTQSIFKSLAKELLEFQQHSGTIIDFEFFKNDGLEQLSFYFKSQKENNPSTISKKIKSLKSFLYYCADIDTFKYSSIKNYSVETLKSPKIILSEQEVIKLYALNLSLFKELQTTRDIFLLGCFTGLSYKEISMLEKKDINDFRLKFENIYGGDPISLPLNNYARMIVLRNEPSGNGRYFDELPQSYANKYIKEIAKKAGLDRNIEVYQQGKSIMQPLHEVISMDIAKITYALISLQSGVRPDIISIVLGQKNIESLLEYNMATKPVKDLDTLEFWNKKVF
jgi:integrase